MNFTRFAEQHGLIIDNLISDRWVRVPTTDHPHKKNGSYKFIQDVGWVQNFATMEQPLMWKAHENIKHDPIERQKRAEKYEKEKLAKQSQAAKKAGWLLHNSKKDTHPYLVKKGFPEEKGYTWNGLLLIPMRKNGELFGCQMIDADGNKKFLTGQLTKGVSAVFDNKGKDIICEGYATALSVRKVLKSVKKRYRIHVCFSAGNMTEIARGLDCIVIADNDPVGIRTAEKTGKKFWVSDKDGEDFNDYERRVGSIMASMTLSPLLN